MSSRLFRSEEKPFSPVPWRQFSPTKAAAAIEKPPAEPEPPPDCSAQIAQMELQNQQKVREARAAGVHEGEIAGRNRAAADLQPVLDRLGRSIQEISNLRARLRREAESDVVKLALAIARRVVRRELSSDPDALRGLVIAALEKLQGQEVSRVRVHPSQESTMRSCLQNGASCGQLEIIADPSREPGSIVFETTRGNLDVSIEAQLQEIERGLTDRLRKQS